MNKTDLIAAVNEKSCYSKKDIAAIIDATFDTIADTLAGGDKVQLTGFGTFEVRNRQARTATNPRTKEKVKVAAKKAPAFKPGAVLKRTVNPDKKTKKKK